MDPEQHLQMKDFITRRQTNRTALVGSTEENRPVIEESFLRLLAVMENHLTHHQFLLGHRPGRGDFGIFGQFTQLCFWEPDSAQIAARQSPRSIMWVYQVDDLSSLDVAGNQGWFTREDLPATLSDLLHEIGQTYAPFMVANHDALAEIGQTYAPFMVANHDALAAGAEKVVCSIRGANYQQAPFRYQSKCLTWLREAFANLSPDDQESVRQLIDGTGCEVLVAQPGD